MMMKSVGLMIALIWLVGFTQTGWAQSTTGARSGGSTASTGTGYLTEGKRPATTNPQSMTIADEGSSRDYMYVPATKNQAASPDGSGNTSSSRRQADSSASHNNRPKKTNRQGSPK